MRFAPRAVSAGNAWGWLREGLALTVRAPIVFVALGIAHAGLYALPGPLGAVAFATMPLLLGVGVAVAAGADSPGGGRAARTVRLSRRAWQRLLLAGAIIAGPVLFVAGGLDGPGGSVLHEFASSGLFGPANSINDALGLAAHGLWFWSLVLSPTVWFMVPLAALADLPFVESVVQSAGAFVLNRFLSLVWATTVGATWLATLLPVLVVPCSALLPAVLYAAYRDVWLGRGRNAPAAVRTGRDPAPRSARHRPYARSLPT